MLCLHHQNEFYWPNSTKETAFAWRLCLWKYLHLLLGFNSLFLDVPAPQITVLLSCLSHAECKNLYLSTSLTYSYLTSSIDIIPDSKVEPPILGNAEPDSPGCHGCIRTAGGGFPTWSGTLKHRERCLGLKYPSPQSLLYYSLMLIMSFGFIWGVAPLTYILRSFNTGKCSPPKRHLFCVHFVHPRPPTKLQSVVVKRCLPGTACIWAEKLIKLKSTTFGKIPFCCNPAASKFTGIHGVFSQTARVWFFKNSSRWHVNHLWRK